MYGIGIDLFSVWRPKLTFVCAGVKKLLRFYLRIENYLVSMYGSELTCFCVRAENYLFLIIVWGSIDLVFVWVVEIYLVIVFGPEITWF